MGVPKGRIRAQHNGGAPQQDAAHWPGSPSRTRTRTSGTKVHCAADYTKGEDSWTAQCGY